LHLQHCLHHAPKKGEKIEVHNPSGLPPVNTIDYIEEPYINAQIISNVVYIGSIMKLCIDKRGVLKNQTYVTETALR